MYPAGKSAFGALDMSGTIREWTLSEVSGSSADIRNNVQRVLRGGSWGRNRNHASVNYRPSEYPGYRDNLIGFRLVTTILP
jgi:formylglycine-generating enzyme required for sulfatase activity